LEETSPAFVKKETYMIGFTKNKEKGKLCD